MKVTFHDVTTRVDDAVGDSRWDAIEGDLPITVFPDNLTGITLAAGASANQWGSNTPIRAASAKPFRIVGVVGQPVTAQLHELQLSADAGSTHFDQMMIESTRGVASPAPARTGYIFNKGTAISGSIKAASAGSDQMQVWLKIQAI